ncbi:hypothetical protein FRC10_006898 [Ceratobasidium sp. 414]|nr:hypothetical protein FRC10_006898 [Ceratobasidium sp. 414]
MIHKNLSAWIADSHGAQLEEYQMKNVDGKTVEYVASLPLFTFLTCRNLHRCWIPSDEGANFRIMWRPIESPQPKLALRCDVRLDGRDISGGVLSAKSITQGAPGVKDGMRIAPSVKRLLVFGCRDLTDRDELASPNDPGQDLGTIQVRLTWVRCTKTGRIHEYFEPKEPGLIHERAAKKGHSTAATLGDPIFLNPKSPVYAIKTHAVSSPVVFTFRYGSKEWLKAKNIIPHESPEPIANQRCSTPVPKSEEPSKKRKREPSPTPTATSSRPPQKLVRAFDPSEVIDIDDSESDADSDVVVLNDL